jgi:hypothetical protein
MAEKIDKRLIAAAVNEIWVILRSMPSPRDAARALAGAHVMLMEEESPRDEADLRAKLKDVDTFVLASWSKRTGIPLAN